jgi:Cu/Ag efflux protein CusF
MIRTFFVVSTSALLIAVAGCQDRPTTERRAEGQGPQAAGRQAANVQGAGTVSGEVVSAKGDEIVLKEQGRDEKLKLKVSDSTQVFIDDRKASINELREGAQVRASFDSAQGERRAMRIDARGGAQAGAGDQPGGSAGTTGGLGGASSRTPGQMGGPGGDSATSASEPGAPRGEPGKSEAQTPEKK